MPNRCIDGMGGFLADQLSRYKHPESFEIVDVSPRDDAGKVRRTLLRDERAAWLKEGRAFRIMPVRARAKALEGRVRRVPPRATKPARRLRDNVCHSRWEFSAIRWLRGLESAAPHPEMI